MCVWGKKLDSNKEVEKDKKGGGILRKFAGLCSRNPFKFRKNAN